MRGAPSGEAKAVGANGMSVCSSDRDTAGPECSSDRATAGPECIAHAQIPSSAAALLPRAPSTPHASAEHTGVAGASETLLLVGRRLGIRDW
jgi:hypothetical protein